MGYDHLLLAHDGPTAVITMNRPARRNALSLDHLRELIAAFTEVADTDAVGIVLAANGPVFSAGHDFAEVGTADLASVRRLASDLHRADGADR